MIQPVQKSGVKEAESTKVKKRNEKQNKTKPSSSHRKAHLLFLVYFIYTLDDMEYGMN